MSFQPSQNDSTIAHSAPGPEEPALQHGSTRALIKKMLINGLNIPVKFLQSLFVGSGTGLTTNFSGQNGAVVATGTAAEFVMGDQAAPAGTNYALWRFASAVAYLDSSYSNAYVQLNCQVLASQFKGSMRVGNGTNISLDGGDGRIIANGTQAGVWHWDRSQTANAKYMAHFYNGGIFNFSTDTNAGVYQYQDSNKAHKFINSLKVGNGVTADGIAGGDGVVVADGTSACFVMGDRAVPTSANAWAHFFLTNGVAQFYHQNGVVPQTWNFSNGLVSIRNSAHIGSYAHYNNPTWDGWLTVGGPNSGVLIESTANDSWAGYFRCTTTNLFLYRHDGVEIARWDLQNARMGVGGVAPTNGLSVLNHISLNGTNNNLIMYGSAGVAPPGAGSLGEKIQLYGTIGTVGAADYALGIESGNMWLNSGGGWRFYSNAALKAYIGSGGGMLLDYGMAIADGSAILAFGSSGVEGIGSNHASGTVNSDANQYGLDLITNGQKRVRLLNNGRLLVGGGNTAGNVAPFNNVLLGSNLPNPGTAAGSEAWNFGLSTQGAGNAWDNLTISNYNFGGGPDWNSFSWLIGRNVNGAVRNIGPYVTWTAAGGLGIQTTNAGYNLTVAGTGYFSGALTKAGGGFTIDHPLKPDTHNLYHGFVEAPRSDLLYRGMVQLVNGEATITIDTDCVRPGANGMTPGTFTALTRDAMIASLQNQSSDRVVYPTGPIVDGKFSIRCDTANADDWVGWVVMAERNDPWTRSPDNIFAENGNMILEPVKPDPNPEIVAALDTPIIQEVEADE